MGSIVYFWRPIIRFMEIHESMNFCAQTIATTQYVHDAYIKTWTLDQGGQSEFRRPQSRRAPPLCLGLIWVESFCGLKLQQNYRHQSKTPGWADFWAV